MNTLVFALLGYLLGSIPFAVVSSRLFGLADPRSYGSGNPGATNVLRSGSKPAALLTLFGDGAKGWLAVFLAQQFGGQPQDVALAGFAAFFGHLHPLFLGFRGGKGVATAAGVLLGLSLLLGLATAASWLIIAFFFRYSSLAAMVAALFAPLCYVFVFGVDPVAAAVAAMSALLVWRHRQNIANLLAGKESRIGAGRRSDLRQRG